MTVFDMVSCIVCVHALLAFAALAIWFSYKYEKQKVLKVQIVEKENNK